MSCGELLAPRARGRELPAESAGTDDDQLSLRVLHLAALAVGDHLREFGAQGLQVLEVAVERRLRLNRGGECEAREHSAQQRATFVCITSHLPGGAGARISRAPFGCSGPTTPAFSMRLEQARGAVVADLEPALHVGDGRLALGGDDLHGLVVQRILLAARRRRRLRAARRRCRRAACSDLRARLRCSSAPRSSSAPRPRDALRRR